MIDIDTVQNRICWMNDVFKCDFKNLSTVVQPDYEMLIYRAQIEVQLYHKFMASETNEEWYLLLFS